MGMVALDYVLTVSCPDSVGIVHAVTGFLLERTCTIVDSAQFGDPDSGRFFLRISFACFGAPMTAAELEAGFAPLAEQYKMDWTLQDAKRRRRLLIMVSQIGHCLNDLLYRYRTGSLNVELTGVVSNHRDFYQLSAWHDVPFHHLPVTPATRRRQEERVYELIENERVDLVVLARYMQILSPEFCQRLPNRIINIHHSFLPSFKGAKPYHQAYARGVKLIGATAHYVTADLDEGPIIEQEVARVDHAMSPEQLIAVGRDIESVVLARAVRLHIEHRILTNGNKTVIFR